MSGTSTAASPTDPATGRGVRAALWVYVACLLVSKLMDANPHPGPGYMPWVLACFVLPVWWLSGRWRAPWLRAPWLLLAVQAAVSGAGLALFGAHWVGGLDGLLGALVLLVVAAPVRWWLFGALAVVEVAAWALVSLPYLPVAASAIWVTVAFLNTGLGLYGMATAALLVDRLETTAELLADAAAERERAAASIQLRTSIADRLDRLRTQAIAALRARTPQEAASAYGEVGRLAREAAVSARTIVTLPAGLEAGRTAPAGLSSRTATRIVTVVVLLYAVQFLANTVISAIWTGTATASTAAMSVLIAAVAVSAQLRHATATPTRRPAGWRWTFLLEIVSSVALYPIFGAGSLLFLAFVGASALLLLRGPARWGFYGATIVALPVLTATGPAATAPASAVSWSVYAAATMAYTGLLLYVLARLPDVASRLERAGAQLVKARAEQERSRIARDAHDALGLALSTIALKSDLARALLDTDPERARRESVQILRLGQNVQADAAAVARGDLRIALAAELAAARHALAAAGVDVQVEHVARNLPGAIDAVLGTVLREAVTNVLRHSDARVCTITIARNADTASVTVHNDRPEKRTRPESGTGLRNVRERLAEVGGSIEVVAARESFQIAAVVPIGRSPRGGAE